MSLCDKRKMNTQTVTVCACMHGGGGGFTAGGGGAVCNVCDVCNVYQYIRG